MCVSLSVRERDGYKTEKETERGEWRKGEERRGIAEPSFILNKAMMRIAWGRHPRQKQAHFPLFRGDPLGREGERHT